MSLCTHTMGQPFFSPGAIPIYGVLPYSMINKLVHLRMCVNHFSVSNDIVTLRGGEGKGPDMEMYVLFYHR